MCWAGPSAEDIPEESTLHNDWQTAKDEGGNLRSHAQNEMKFLRQDKFQGNSSTV